MYEGLIMSHGPLLGAFSFHFRQVNFQFKECWASFYFSLTCMKFRELLLSPVLVIDFLIRIFLSLHHGSKGRFAFFTWTTSPILMSQGRLVVKYFKVFWHWQVFHLPISGESFIFGPYRSLGGQFSFHMNTEHMGYDGVEPRSLESIIL